ncbi:hypothetical protein ALPO108162_03465 [Alicyclobacillus pomorum]
MELVGLQVTGPGLASNGGNQLCCLNHKESVQASCGKVAQKIWRNCGYGDQRKIMTPNPHTRPCNDCN